MGEREIARYYTLSDKDLRVIRQHRRDHNRLGFSIQLCHLRFPGWPLKAGDEPPSKLLAYAARQLNVSPEVVHSYSRDRDTTRREHLLELQRDFGFQSFTEALSSRVSDLLLPDALRSPKPMPLIAALLDQLRTQKIIVPAFSTVENLAWEILARAETKIFDQLTSGLTLVQRRQLDQLTAATDNGAQGLGWLRQASGRPTPVNFLRVCEKLRTVRAIGPAVSWLWEIGMIPERPIRPRVGLIPTRQHADDGQMIDPSVSVPTPATARFAAMPAPVPELDPSGLRSRTYGLRHCPPRELQPLIEWLDRKFAHSLMLALPSITAPASWSL